jgi:hypothetical protein
MAADSAFTLMEKDPLRTPAMAVAATSARNRLEWTRGID